MAEVKHYIYGIARLHLSPRAGEFVRLPRSATFILPVNFVSKPEASWSLIILPDELVEVCRWTNVKVGLLLPEHGEDYLHVGEEFTISGTAEVGHGVIVSVVSCSAEEYYRMFRYPNP